MYKKFAKLDVVPGGRPQRFYISEHDVKSRHLPFTLFASEGELELPQGTTAKLEGTKPDGTELTVSAAINGVGVTVDLPAAAADVKRINFTGEAERVEKKTGTVDELMKDFNKTGFYEDGSEEVKK